MVMSIIKEKQEKPCKKCGATDRTNRGECRPCAKASSAKYRAENIEKEKIRQAKYHADNFEKERERSAKYRAENLDKVKAAQAKSARNIPQSG
jgi:predicted ATP-dependent serine protease